ncbi:MAG: NGG1p interacting factor NIF3 [Gammaproteobacteria bacterium]|nr:NGG1p interacting factor NIF3 [Gammaproteobacteria bacterium]
MIQISFYVPNNDAETVKMAMFEAGAGSINNYTHCAWQTEGVGQFMPTQGAKPAFGELSQLEILPELKIEMVCDDDCIDQVVRAMKVSHPYEEVAYSVIKLENT